MRFMILLVTVFSISCYGDDEPIYKVCGQPGVEGNYILVRSIVNGKVDKDYDCVVKLEAPIKSGVNMRCSGVVIGDRTIITAAHCVMSDHFLIFINDDYIGVSKNIHKHPTKDFALVFTTQDLDLPVANLPERESKYYRDAILTTVGYGNDRVNPSERRRKYGNSTIIGIDQDGLLVTQEYDTEVDHGDSGGGLMYCSTLVGVLVGSRSFKEEGGVDNKAYYTPVFENLDWIYSKMEENE